MANVVEALGQDVRAVEVTSSGTQAIGSGAAVRGVYYVPSGTAGSVTIRDGGSTGTVKLSLQTGADNTGVMLPVPGSGIVFDTDVYVEFSNVAGVTVFY